MTEIDELYKSVIIKSQKNLELLGQRLVELKDLRADLIKQGEAILKEANESKEEAIAIPKAFQEKFEEISKVSKEYLEILDQSIEKYLEGNNSLFVNKIDQLKEKTIKLGEEITRLEGIDPADIFESHSKVFIKKLDLEFKKIFDELGKKSSFIQDRNEELKGEVKRLEAVDLQANFDKHQKTLNDVFGAMNGMNSIISNVVQNQTKLFSYHEEQGKIINEVLNNGAIMLGHLDFMKLEIDKNKLELLDIIEIQRKSISKLNILSIVQIVGILIIMALIYYFR